MNVTEIKERYKYNPQAMNHFLNVERERQRRAERAQNQKKVYG